MVVHAHGSLIRQACAFEQMEHALVWEWLDPRGPREQNIATKHPYVSQYFTVLGQKCPSVFEVPMRHESDHAGLSLGQDRLLACARAQWMDLEC
jgi:hypothetical protein